MPKFIKKPVIVEAYQFTGDNDTQLQDWSKGKVMPTNSLKPCEANPSGKYMHIFTLEGVMSVYVNDWVIQGIKGEFYPCKPDIFAATYQIVATNGI